MRRILTALALAGAFLLGSTHAQTTTITASNIADVGGNSVTGQFCVTPAQQFVRSGGGNVVPIQVCYTITAGALQDSVVLADTSLTNPVDVCYRVVIKNAYQEPIASYACMQPSGSTYSFDDFVQASPPYISTSFTVPNFLTNGVLNAGQSHLNIAATAPITATNSGSQVTIACPTCGDGDGGSSVSWQGAWSSSTTYAIDDAVGYEGSSYIALAATTNVTPGTNESDWALLAQSGEDGATGATGDTGATGPQGATGATGAAGAKGDPGDTGATGAAGNAATISIGTVTTGAAGSSAAVSNSGSENAAVFDFTIPQGAKGDKGDTGDTGAQGPQGNSGGSTTWLGAWSSSTEYVLDDAVSYDGSSYIALATNTDVTPGTNPSDWQVLAEKGDTGTTGADGAKGDQGDPGATGSTGATGADGLSVNWKGAWSSGTSYAINDAVSYDGSSYIAIVINSASEPDLNLSDWDLLAAVGSTGATGSTGADGPKGDQGDKGDPGDSGATGATGAAGTSLVWLGSWDSGTSYVVDNAVSLNGSSYVALISNSDASPDSNPTDWSLLAQKGDTGSTGATGAGGAKGDKGDPGDTGATGDAGPNAVSTSTTTTLNCLLKGNGSDVACATAGTDYDAAGAATTAQSNAEIYAADASNLSSGTVNALRLPTALANSSSVNGTSIPSSATLTVTIASGTASLATSGITSGACASVVTVTATGVLSTDNLSADFNGDPTSTLGYEPGAMLTIIKWPSAGDVHFKVCNNTASSETPGAVTLNWRVTR